MVLLAKAIYFLRKSWDRCSWPSFAIVMKESASDSDGPNSIDSSINVSLLPDVLLSKICLAILSSSWTLISSLIIQIISNLEAKGGGSPVSWKDLMTLWFGPLLLNRPSLGFAAAKIAHLECRVAVIPPFAT